MNAVSAIHPVNDPLSLEAKFPQGGGIAGRHLRVECIRTDIGRDPPGAGALAANGGLRNDANLGDLRQTEGVGRALARLDGDRRRDADLGEVRR